MDVGCFSIFVAGMVLIAKSMAWNTEFGTTRMLRNKLIVCVVATGVALYSGVGTLLAVAGSGACDFAALADYDSGVAACFGSFMAAVGATKTTRNAAQDSARVVFGDENCPDGLE